MMARATRSTTADLKRKRSLEEVIDVNSHDNDGHVPAKLPKITEDESTTVDGRGLLTVLEQEDPQGLLDRVFPDQSASLRSLLTTTSSVGHIKRAISLLKPISSQPRAKLTPTAAQQLAFCNLALSLVEQLVPLTDLHTKSELPSSEDPAPRPQLSYALLQHLPSGDYWSSIAHAATIPKNLSTGNAELVAILPTPSSSSSVDGFLPTIGAYSTKATALKKPALLPHRRVTTCGFLDYGLYSSFAPSFDHDGEIVGKNQLGEVLWYREEKKRIQEAVKRERLEGSGSITEISSVPPDSSSPQQEEEQDLELEALLPSEDVEAIKVALNNLDLEKSVQTLLERNQRALERLEELQYRRLTKHPTSSAEEGTEEYETAQAIMDSLTLLASLRPRSSAEEAPAIIPPPSVLHKLHRTLFVQASPGWYGTLPAGRTTALHDDSTIKVRPGTATPAPATTSTPTPAPASNAFSAYPYTYNAQQSYRPQQATAYTPYKPNQPSTFYQGYQQQQNYYSPQTYTTAVTTNQQPYGTVGQQQYAGGYTGSWYQYSGGQSGTGSGRGTPQPTTASMPTASSLAPTYGSFFSTTTNTSTPTTAGRTPAIANTVIGNTNGQATGITPTLPVHVRNTATPQAGFYQLAPQPAR